MNRAIFAFVTIVSICVGIIVTILVGEGTENLVTASVWGFVACGCVWLSVAIVGTIYSLLLEGSITDDTLLKAKMDSLRNAGKVYPSGENR